MENSNNTQPQENNQPPQDNTKVNEYIKELLKEKNNLDPSKSPIAMRLLEEEVVKAQAKGKPVKESKYVDIYREKPVRVTTKVLVPVKEHPRFNFVGKLLGPKGNSLRRLQEETMTKMAILGRGSMRDKQKEEEWRNTLDPKYSHLSEELHVEISALAPPAESHARIAFALAELRKYLVPDSNDEIRLEQLREIQSDPGRRGAGRGRAPPPPPPRGAGRATTGLAPPPPRPAPSKAKVLSILDRARQAMEEPAYPDYEEAGPYGYEPPPPAGYAGDYEGGAEYYDTPAYSAAGAGRWKGYKSAVVGRGYGAGAARPVPYSRPVPK